MSIDDRREKLYKELKRIKDDYSYIDQLGLDNTSPSAAPRKLLKSYFQSGLDQRFFDLLYAISAVPHKIPRRKDLDDHFRPGSYPHCLK